MLKLLLPLLFLLGFFFFFFFFVFQLIFLFVLSVSSVCTVSFFFCFPFICPNSANNDPSQRKMEEGACVFARRPFEEPLQREVPLGPAIEKQVSQAECFHADSSLQHLQFTCDIFPYNLRDGWDTSAMCGWQLVGEALGSPPHRANTQAFPSDIRRSVWCFIQVYFQC